MADKALKINKSDNVAVLLKDFSSGSKIKLVDKEIEIKEDIPLGHKIALEDIARGDKIVKYGFSIGKALGDIPTGAWVHSHNIKTSLEGKQVYTYNLTANEKGLEDGENIPTFKGYNRKNGQVGIRNEIWLIPTVGCINKPVEKMALLAEQKFSKQIAEGKIDGIYAFSHPYGCSQLGCIINVVKKKL